MPAKELRRRVNLATRTVVVDVEDDFGIVTPHTLPLIGDHCPHCGSQLPGNSGVRDMDASATAAVKHIDDITEQILPHLEKAGVDVAAVKAKRSGK
jgi:hypothetical protein